MGVGLLLAAAAAYWATQSVLRREFDRGLIAAAFLAYEHFETTAEHPGLDPLLASDRPRYARDVNRYLVLRDATGVPTRSLPAFAGDLPLDSAAFDQALAGARTWGDGVWHGEAIRSFYTPFERHGVSGGQVLQVTASLAPIAAVQRVMIIVLLAVTLVGTLVTWAGAWVLAGSAVRPVYEITAQAMKVEAGTLDQRIAAHAETDEYRGLVAVLNRMLERLDLAFRNQRRLTADVSHELRSPLTALRGEMEVALRSERSPRDYQRVMHSALEEIDRLTEMSDDLLLITRADAGLLKLERDSTDLNDLVERVLGQLEGRIEERELKIDRRLAPEASAVSLDPALMTRVVHHLLDNAVKFTPPGGVVRVTTSGLGNGHGGGHLTVQDTGPGIGADQLPHIFEPFYRADQARSRGTGTGLGLAMAAAIVRLHGGTIHAANVSGPAGAPGGARFDVQLPG